MSTRILISLLFTVTIASASLSCLDLGGEPVPWFAFLKYPGNVTNGTARYAYLDPNYDPTFITVLGSYCDGEASAMTRTIESINAIPRESLNQLLFNDEPPNVPYNPFGGHAKGIIAFDNATQTGVYIMHSFPKFPDFNSNDGTINTTLPHNTIMYGQHGYCISLDTEILGHLINNLPVEVPNVYYASGVFQAMPPKADVNSSISQFNLLNGDEQWFLTKNPDYPGFLYEHIIAPYFNVSLAVESWGRPYQTPYCPNDGTPQSYNIQRITFNSKDSWDHFSDHAKWTVTLAGEPELACMCDMNRMDTQGVRGGSCLCSKNTILYEALRKLIVTTDTCSQISF